MTELGLTQPRLFREAAYIDGQWVSSTKTIKVVDPANGRNLGTIPNLGRDHAMLAVAAAFDAFASWRSLTAKHRGLIMRRWSELMMFHRIDLARLLTAEQGKPFAEAEGEVSYAASFVEWFAEECRRVCGDVISPHQSDRRLLVVKEPVGVVAAITPWNFPLAMIARKAGPALSVGCTMVVKPSELTPYSALALAELAQEAGMPQGVFNVITGEPAPIGDVLTSDKRVRKFTFTGSTLVGKSLAARCMKTVKRVSLELGGNAPFIVFDDADLGLAVDGAMQSKFRNAGQTCISANRMLVQSGTYDEFLSRLCDRVAQLKLGAGLKGPSDQGPLINAKAVEKAKSHIEDAVKRGARVVIGGSPCNAEGNFFEPTVIADVPSDALLCREETFAPVAALIRFETEEEAIALANATDAGLASYIFTADMDRSWRVSEALECGMIGLNTGLISTELAPFGGTKESGIGREGSRYGIDDYLELKLICVAVQ